MCFFDQMVFTCGDFKWTHLRQQCLAEKRIGETCALKLVMSTIRIYEKCASCERLARKISRFWKEEQRVMRWKTSARVAKDSQQCIARSRTASIETSKRTLEELRRDILKMQRKRQHPFMSFNCEDWINHEDSNGDNIGGSVQDDDMLPGLKLLAMPHSSTLRVAEAEPFPPESNMFMLRLLEFEIPGCTPRQVESRNDTDNPPTVGQEQQSMAFMLTMQLFRVAYESSISPDGTVHLPSGRVLSCARYPGVSRRLLTYIHSLKTDLLHSGLSSQLSEADTEVEGWLPRVAKALKAPESIVDNEPRQLQRLVATLREIQSQIRYIGFRKIYLAPQTKEP